MSKNNTIVIKTKKNLSFAKWLKCAKNKGDIAAGLMLLPAVIMLLVVSVYPFCWVFRYVCYEYNGLTATYTGMHNFERMLTDTTFWQSVLHTFEYAVLKIIFIIPLALIMAVFLNQKLRGSSFFRGVYFMPTIISTAVSSMVFGFIFAAYNGVLNGVLKAIGVIGQNVNWLGDAKTAMWSVLIVALWAGFGNYMIYFISGMSSPMLKIILMLAITGAFKDYESIMVLTNGGPNNRTQVMFLYIYQLIFGKDVGTNPQIGYATVLSLVAALIIGIVTAVYMYFARKLDEVV